jgi:hypothetical protein
MNVRDHLKCDVCGTVTLLRTQIGWLDQHPIRVYCGECGILMSGNIFLNQEEGTFNFEFSNCTSVSNDDTPKYYIEASGELLTEKLQLLEKDYFYSLPPFFITSDQMGNENFKRFSGNIKGFLHLVKNDWPRVRRINELWLSGKTEYLAKEVLVILSKDQFPMNNNLEYIRGVHQVNLLFLHNVLEHSFFKETTNFLWNQIKLLSSANPKELIELVKDFEDSGLLHIYNEKVFKITCQFVDKFQFLIPAFGLRYYSEINEDIYKEKGITTASFEDLKQFYLDCYEAAGELSRLIVAFNNLKNRHQYKQMAEKRKDIRTIQEYDGKPKGIRLGFISGEEDFDQLVYPNLDNRLRNAIGHNTCKFDGRSQVITYYPSGEETENDKNEKFLLQFCQDCLNIFQSILNVEELIYQTRKIFYISQGCKPTDPEVFNRRTKVGRNDPCPCGSGKKYKKCCGNI